MAPAITHLEVSCLAAQSSVPQPSPPPQPITQPAPSVMLVPAHTSPLLSALQLLTARKPTLHFPSHLGFVQVQCIVPAHQNSTREVEGCATRQGEEREPSSFMVPQNN